MRHRPCVVRGMRCDSTSTWHMRNTAQPHAHRIEKIGDCKDLRDDKTNDTGADERLLRATRKAVMCQSGTDSSSATVPNSLSSSFTAQVLGQLLETNKAIPVDGARA